MSERAVVQAVASTLYNVLGLGDLDSFIHAFRNYRHDVIAVLESDECCAAADAATVATVHVGTSTDADVGTATEARQMRDASSTAAFTSPAAKIVLQVGSFRAKDKACQTSKALSKDAAVGTRVKSATKDAAVGTRSKMVSCGVQAEAFRDLEARMMHECRAVLAPQLERAVATAEAAEMRIRAQLKEEALARHANAERRSRDAAAAAADRAIATAERQAAKASCDEVASLREVAAAVEEERATAEREIERAREIISQLNIMESILREELWSEENEHSEQHAAWKRELDRSFAAAGVSTAEVESLRAHVSELEQEKEDLEDTREGLYIMLNEVREAYGPQESREWVSMSYMRARCTCGALPSAFSEA